MLEFINNQNKIGEISGSFFFLIWDGDFRGEFEGNRNFTESWETRREAREEQVYIHLFVRDIGQSVYLSEINCSRRHFNGDKSIESCFFFHFCFTFLKKM